MLDKLRDWIIAFLAEHHVCIFSTAGSQGARAMPVHYHNDGLELDCLLPRWADAVYHLEGDQRVALVVPTAGRTWLQILGLARPLPRPNGADLLPDSPGAAAPDGFYLAFRITPTRINLLDKDRGWGVRETLDL